MLRLVFLAEINDTEPGQFVLEKLTDEYSEWAEKIEVPKDAYPDTLTVEDIDYPEHPVFWPSDDNDEEAS